MSRRLKSGNKKAIHNKKLIHSRVAPEFKDINERITKYAEEDKTKQGTIQV